MNTFSELTILIERLINHLPQESFAEATSNAKEVSEECLTLLTALNKAAFYTEHDEHGAQSLSELSEANAILSELGGRMMRLQAERNSIA